MNAYQFFEYFRIVMMNIRQKHKNKFKKTVKDAFSLFCVRIIHFII